MTQRDELLQVATRGLAGVLGIVLVRVDDAGVEATMPVGERTHQPFGMLHGGASIALAETVASIGSASRIDLAQFMAVGQEINGNHLRGKSAGVVTARATPVHLGRTSHVWTIEITDEEGQLVCVSRCTMAIVPRRSNEPAR